MTEADSAVPIKEASSPHKQPKRFEFFTRPVQRQRWGDTQIHPVVNWGDLFFDLFYVAAAYNLSNIIRESPTSEGLLYFVGCFWSVMAMWWDKMVFDSRFYTHDDVWHRVFEVAVLCVLATAVVHIRPVALLSDSKDNVDMFAFCLAVCLGSFLTIVRYLEIIYDVDGQPVAKVAAWRDIRSKLIPASFYFAAMIVSAVEFYGNNSDGAEGDDHAAVDAVNTTTEAVNATTEGHRFMASTTSTSYAADTTNLPIWLLCAGGVAWIVWGAIVIVFLFPGGGRHKEVTVPMNVDFAIHRYGEWTMLMLGESILSLLIVDVAEGVDYYVTFYAGILSVVLLQYMHFRSQPHHADDHAIRRKKEAGYAFTVLMQVYSAALIILGVCYKMLLYEYTYETEGERRMLLDVPRWLAGDSAALAYDAEDRQQRIANFFCGSLAIVWICSDSMLLVHKGLKDNLGRCRCKHTHKTLMVGVLMIALRVGLILFVATLSMYVTDPEHLAVIGLAGIAAQVALRVISCSVFPDDRVHIDTGHTDDNRDEDKWPNVTQAQAEPAREVDENDVYE